MSAPSTPETARPRLPGAVITLGFVSMLTDTGSELIMSVMPIFLVAELGVGSLALGLVEGVGELVASIFKVASGWYSDRMRRRKPLLVAGYGLATVAKVLFPIATSATWVIAARALDRVGKGLRGAPRDALVADITEPDARPRAYALRQSLDTIGAILGPLLASLLLVVLAGDLRTVLWIGVLPGIVGVALVAWRIREPSSASPGSERHPPASGNSGHGGGSRAYLLLVVALIGASRYSETFFLLEAGTRGAAPERVPLILLSMNILYAASALPLALAAQIIGRRRMLLIAQGCLAIASCTVAFSGSVVALVVAAAAFGLHMGASQGLLASLVALVAPPGRRALAFGAYHLVSGLALLVANVGIGHLMQRVGTRNAFLIAAGCALLAAVAILPSHWLPPRARPR